MTTMQMVPVRVPGKTRDTKSQIKKVKKAMKPNEFRPNAETLAAFAEVERGGLKRFDSVEALFADLHAGD